MEENKSIFLKYRKMKEGKVYYKFEKDGVFGWYPESEVLQFPEAIEDFEKRMRKKEEEDARIDKQNDDEEYIHPLTFRINGSFPNGIKNPKETENEHEKPEKKRVYKKKKNDTDDQDDEKGSKKQKVKKPKAKSNKKKSEEEKEDQETLDLDPNTPLKEYKSPKKEKIVNLKSPSQEKIIQPETKVKDESNVKIEYPKIPKMSKSPEKKPDIIIDLENEPEEEKLPLDGIKFMLFDCKSMANEYNFLTSPLLLNNICVEFLRKIQKEFQIEGKGLYLDIEKSEKVYPNYTFEKVVKKGYSTIADYIRKEYQYDTTILVVTSDIKVENVCDYYQIKYVNVNTFLQYAFNLCKFSFFPHENEKPINELIQIYLTGINEYKVVEIEVNVSIPEYKDLIQLVETHSKNIDRKGDFDNILSITFKNHFSAKSFYENLKKLPKKFQTQIINPFAPQIKCRVMEILKKKPVDEKKKKEIKKTEEKVKENKQLEELKDQGDNVSYRIEEMNVEVNEPKKEEKKDENKEEKKEEIKEDEELKKKEEKKEEKREEIKEDVELKKKEIISEERKMKNEKLDYEKKNEKKRIEMQKDMKGERKRDEFHNRNSFEEYRDRRDLGRDGNRHSSDDRFSRDKFRENDTYRSQNNISNQHKYNRDNGFNRDYHRDSGLNRDYQRDTGFNRDHPKESGLSKDYKENRGNQEFQFRSLHGYRSHNRRDERIEQKPYDKNNYNSRSYHRDYSPRNSYSRDKYSDPKKVELNTNKTDPSPKKVDPSPNQTSTQSTPKKDEQTTPKNFSFKDDSPSKVTIEKNSSNESIPNRVEPSHDNLKRVSNEIPSKAPEIMEEKKELAKSVPHHEIPSRVPERKEEKKEPTKSTSNEIPSKVPNTKEEKKEPQEKMETKHVVKKFSIRIENIPLQVDTEDLVEKMKNYKCKCKIFRKVNPIYAIVDFENENDRYRATQEFNRVKWENYLIKVSHI